MDNLAAAQELYAVAKASPCRCETRWSRNDRVLVSECRRCRAVASWEAAFGLPASPRLALELERQS